MKGERSGLSDKVLGACGPSAVEYMVGNGGV